MQKYKVLFVCMHNSARSQMAEALLKNIAADEVEVESAGLEPGKLNPLAVAVMKEIGIDISENRTKSIFDFFKQGRRYHYIITVCDQAQAQKFPVFPGVKQTFNCSFPDPAGFSGTYEEKLDKTRQVRDAIKAKIEEWLTNVKMEGNNGND